MKSCSRDVAEEGAEDEDGLHCDRMVSITAFLKTESEDL
jgi:hypothetical protein